MTDPTIPTEPEPCEYCGAKNWNITATLIGCHGCGVVYGRVNGAWVLDPDTVPGSGRKCPECHMVERCKMSCSRGGSKGARVSVSPREGGE